MRFLLKIILVLRSQVLSIKINTLRRKKYIFFSHRSISWVSCTTNLKKKKKKGLSELEMNSINRFRPVVITPWFWFVYSHLPLGIHKCHLAVFRVNNGDSLALMYGTTHTVYVHVFAKLMLHEVISMIWIKYTKCSPQTLLELLFLLHTCNLIGQSLFCWSLKKSYS